MGCFFWYCMLFSHSMSVTNENARLETFCDGIFAIAITLLVLEIKVPPHETVHSVNDLWLALSRLWPSLFAWCLSFIIILLTWLTHHRIFSCINRSSLHFMYANGVFMFIVTLYPFASAIVAEYFSTDYAQPAVAVYSACNLLLSLSLRLLLISCARPVSLAKDEQHARTLVAMRFGQKISTPVSIAAIILSFWFPHIAFYTITLFWGYVVLRTFWLQKKFDK